MKLHDTPLKWNCSPVILAILAFFCIWVAEHVQMFHSHRHVSLVAVLKNSKQNQQQSFDRGTLFRETFVYDGVRCCVGRTWSVHSVCYPSVRPCHQHSDPAAGHRMCQQGLMHTSAMVCLAEHHCWHAAAEAVTLETVWAEEHYWLNLKVLLRTLLALHVHHHLHWRDL